MNLDLRKEAQDEEFELPYYRLFIKIRDSEVFGGLWQKIREICRNYYAEYWAELPLILPDNVTFTSVMYNFPAKEDANKASEEIKQLLHDNHIVEAAMKLVFVEPSDFGGQRYVGSEWVWSPATDEPLYFPEIDLEDIEDV